MFVVDIHRPIDFPSKSDTPTASMLATIENLEYASFNKWLLYRCKVNTSLILITTFDRSPAYLCVESVLATSIYYLASKYAPNPSSSTSFAHPCIYGSRYGKPEAGTERLIMAQNKYSLLLPGGRQDTSNDQLASLCMSSGCFEKRSAFELLE